MKRVPVIHMVGRTKMPVKAAGYHKPNTNEIYIDKKQYDERIKHHELYHHRKNHPDKPRDAKTCIDNEIEAELYAQNKTRIRGTRGWYSGLLDSLYEDYKIDHGTAIVMIGERLRRHKVPDAWWRDYRKVAGDVYEAMRKTKRF
jgi:hypothetical protein